MNMEGTVYISGKITGVEGKAAPLFAEAKKYLEKLGFEKAINPMDLNHEHNKSWESYMRVCIPALCECTHIYMLKNWMDSKGARVEFSIAQHLKIAVIYEMDYDKNKSI